MIPQRISMRACFKLSILAGEKNYRATFSITPCKTICLKLISAEEVNIPSTDLSNKFEFDTLKIRKLKYKDKFYEVNLRLTDSENLLFEVINSNLTSSSDISINLVDCGRT